MALYTRLDAADVARLARRFGRETRRFHHIGAGVENTSYFVASDDGDAVLTVLEKRGLADARSYSRYLRSLAENRLPVPRSLACGDGDYVTKFGGKPVIMLEYVRGTQYDRLPVRYLFEIGTTLGVLHTSPVDCALSPHIRLAEAALDAAEQFADRPFARWLVQSYRRISDAAPLSDGPRVPTHGDLFPDNIVVTADGSIVLLDWEDGARDSFLVDLGMATLGLCCDGGDEFVPARLNDLLAGYRSANDVEIGRRALLGAIVYVALFTAYNRYVKQRATGPPAAGGRSYRVLPPLIASVERRWHQVEV